MGRLSAVAASAKAAARASPRSSVSSCASCSCSRARTGASRSTAKSCSVPFPSPRASDRSTRCGWKSSSGIQRQLETSGEGEVSSKRIGEMVMEGLKGLDRSPISASPACTASSARPGISRRLPGRWKRSRRRGVRVRLVAMFVAWASTSLSLNGCFAQPYLASRLSPPSVQAERSRSPRESLCPKPQKQ